MVTLTPKTTKVPNFRVICLHGRPILPSRFVLVCSKLLAIYTAIFVQKEVRIYKVLGITQVVTAVQTLENISHQAMTIFLRLLHLQ